MSFWPFPTNLVAELQRAAGVGPVLELGAGRGELARRLESLRLDVLTLDLDPFAPVDVVGDVRCLPFADATAGALVLGDVLRHLDAGTREDAASASHAVLASTGCVVVLEDHPEGRDAAEVNYRETLALLADVMPTRGPARRIDRLTGAWRSHFGSPVLAGEAENTIEVVDPHEPIRWLRRTMGSDRSCRDRLDSLAESVAETGMRYGRFCFEVFVREAR